MLRRRAKPYRIVAWLAMLAMGLLLLAPLVSRFLMAFAVMPGMAMADCPAMPNMAGNLVGHLPGNHGHGVPHDPTPPSTDACGYCSLLFHSPALAATVPVLPPALPLAATPLPAKVSGALVLALPAPRSRGPPLA